MDMLDRVSSGPKAWLILFLITFIAAAPGVFSLPALDRDESRYAQASKQMLETNDYIRIRYQDEMRNKKPAGIYWLQAGSTALLSPDNKTQIWSYRVPSWLGAALATLATFWAGIVVVGRRPAFIGAAFFGSTILLTTEAHIAKTDAVLVLFTTLAMGALARLWLRAGSDKRMALIVWLAVGLGFLIKGPVTPMVVGLAALTLTVWNRFDWRWAKSLFWWPGPLIFILMIVPWLIAIQIATDGAFLDEAIGKDLRDKVAGASEGHGGPPGYHLLYLPTHFFPATLILIPAIMLVIQALRRRTLETLGEQRLDGLKYLVAWAAPTWLFFELLPTKLSHYALPAYPALALMVGWAVMQMAQGQRAPIARYASLIIFALGAIILLAISSPIGDAALINEAASDYKSIPADTAMAFWADNTNYPLWLWAAGLVATLGTIIASLIRKAGLGVMLAILASLLIGWHIRVAFLPAQAWVQPTTTAREALASVCALPDDNPGSCQATAPDHVQAVGYAEPSFVLTVGTNSTIPPQTSIGLPATDAGYPIAYLLNTESDAGIAALDELKTAASIGQHCLTQSEPYYAINYSNGDPVVFAALRIDAAPCQGLPDGT